MIANTQQLEDAIAIDPAALGVTTLSAVRRNKKLKLRAAAKQSFR